MLELVEHVLDAMLIIVESAIYPHGCREVVVGGGLYDRMWLMPGDCPGIRQELKRLLFGVISSS